MEEFSLTLRDLVSIWIADSVELISSEFVSDKNDRAERFVEAWKKNIEFESEAWWNIEIQKFSEFSHFDTSISKYSDS